MKVKRSLALLVLGLLLSGIVLGFSQKIGFYLGVDAIIIVTWVFVKRIVPIIGIAVALVLAALILLFRKQKAKAAGIIACCIVAVASLSCIVFSSNIVAALSIPPESFNTAADALRMFGLSALIAMALALGLGLLKAKKKMIVTVIVMIVFAALSYGLCYLLVLVLNMGVRAYGLGIGVLMPMTLLYPVISVNREAIMTNAKLLEKTAVTKDDPKYSYLEAYKNKHK